MLSESVLLVPGLLLRNFNKVTILQKPFDLLHIHDIVIRIGFLNSNRGPQAILEFRAPCGANVGWR